MKCPKTQVYCPKTWVLSFLVLINQQIFNQLPDGFFFQGGDKLVVGGDTQALRRLAKVIRQTAI